MGKILDRIHANPMTWKDWITASGLVLTLAAVLIQGGRTLERLEQTNAKLLELNAQMNSIRSELTAAQRDLIQQQGVDRLHDERIQTLRRDLDQRAGLRVQQ